MEETTQIKTELSKIRKQRNIDIAIWVIGFSLVLVIGYFKIENLQNIYSIILFVALLISYGHITSIKCPRCSKTFHGKGAFWGNLFQRHCYHCGLHISGKHLTSSSSGTDNP